MRLLTVVLVAPMLLTLPGCGKSNEELIKAMIDEMNNVADLVDKDASKDQINAAVDRLDKVIVDLKDRKTTDSEGKRLVNKYKEQLTKATVKYMLAVTKLKAKDKTTGEKAAAVLGKFNS